MFGTRQRSTIQKVKKMALFTAISTARMMKAPRSASADRTLVARSAVAKRVVAFMSSFAESREPRAESREPRAESRLSAIHHQPSDRIREHRARNRRSHHCPEQQRQRQHPA